MGALPVLEKCRLDLLSNASSCRRPTSYTYTSSLFCKLANTFSSPPLLFLLLSRHPPFIPSSSHSPLSLSDIYFLPNRHHPFLDPKKRREGRRGDHLPNLGSIRPPAPSNQPTNPTTQACLQRPAFKRTRIDQDSNQKEVQLGNKKEDLKIGGC